MTSVVSTLEVNHSSPPAPPNPWFYCGQFKMLFLQIPGDRDGVKDTIPSNSSAIVPFGGARLLRGPASKCFPVVSQLTLHPRTQGIEAYEQVQTLP